MSDEKKRKCQDCGYLGVRDWISHKLISPNESQRNTGTRPANHEMTINPDDKPICGVGEHDLTSELKGDGPGAFLVVVETGRNREEHTAWMPGLEISEHIDMNMLKEQREANRLALERQKEANERMLERQISSNKEIADGNRDVWRFCAKVGIGGALIGAVLGSTLGFLLSKNSGLQDRPIEIQVVTENQPVKQPLTIEQDPVK